MLVAQLTGSGFDILNVAETETSLIRTNNLVRLSWKDEASQLVQLVKVDVATAGIGTSLVARGNCAMPTGDRRSGVVLGKLLAPMSEAVQEKQVTIDGTTYTAKLLPIQLH